MSDEEGRVDKKELEVPSVSDAAFRAYARVVKIAQDMQKARENGGDPAQLDALNSAMDLALAQLNKPEGSGRKDVATFAVEVTEHRGGYTWHLMRKFGDMGELVWACPAAFTSGEEALSSATDAIQWSIRRWGEQFVITTNLEK